MAFERGPYARGSISALSIPVGHWSHTCRISLSQRRIELGKDSTHRSASFVGAAPHRRELKGSAQDKRSISERSCLAPTLSAYRPGSAQGTTPTVSHPPFVLTHFRTFVPMGASPVPPTGVPTRLRERCVDRTSLIIASAQREAKVVAQSAAEKY